MMSNNRFRGRRSKIRQKLLNKQMKILQLQGMSSPSDIGKSEKELRDLVRHSERYRCLCMWHDHATILKIGFDLITVHVMYDLIAECEQLHPGVYVDVQSEVEKPEIHLGLQALTTR